jgi:hypothetical protein
MRGRFVPLLALAALAVSCGDSERRAPGAAAIPVSALGPVGERGGVRVFSGQAVMLLDGPPCTYEEGAEGDRWCGFLAVSSTGRDDLYVLNVSAVRAGVPVTCNDADPNCLLLAPEVIANGNSSRFIYFGGDTLVYYDATLTPRVWRPGMESGRLLAELPGSGEIISCAPAGRGTAIACLELPDDPEQAGVFAAELYVGTADGESEPLLAPIDHVILGQNSTFSGVKRFNSSFPTDGYIAWSSPEDTDSPDILKLARADDLESTVTVTSDIQAWGVSPDATRWHWVTPYGVLQTAPFPDADETIDLLSDVRDYGVSRNGSLVALTTGADLLSIPDPATSPEGQLLLDQGVQELLGLSGGDYVAYAKHVFNKKTSDLFVAHLDGRPPCTVEETVKVPFSSLSLASGGGALLWARSTPEGYDAFLTSLAECSTTPVGPDVAVLGWLDDRTVVFVDEFDSAASSGSLRYRRATPEGAIERGAPGLIAKHVTTNATTGSTLLYTVKATGDEDGVYVRAFER